MKILVTDIETNGLYFQVNKFWCAWIHDPVSGWKMGFRPHQLKEYCDILASADVIVGHNIVDYDIPALQKLNPGFRVKRCFDTLVLSRMLEPDRIQGHSLKQWGLSLGLLKGTYGEENEEAWDRFSEDMFDYCEQDVEVTVMLYKHLCEKAGFDYANPPASRL